MPHFFVIGVKQTYWCIIVASECKKLLLNFTGWYPLVIGVSYRSLGNMAPTHANFHQLISIEKLIVSVCRYNYSLSFTQWNKVYIKLNYFACSVGRHQQAETFCSFPNDVFNSQPSSLFRGIFSWLNSLALHHRPWSHPNRPPFQVRSPPTSVFVTSSTL